MNLNSFCSSNNLNYKYELLSKSGPEIKHVKIKRCSCMLLTYEHHANGTKETIVSSSRTMYLISAFIQQWAE